MKRRNMMNYDKSRNLSKYRRCNIGQNISFLSLNICLHCHIPTQTYTFSVYRIQLSTNCLDFNNKRTNIFIIHRFSNSLYSTAIIIGYCVINKAEFYCSVYDGFQLHLFHLGSSSQYLLLLFTICLALRWYMYWIQFKMKNTYNHHM